MVIVQSRKGREDGFLYGMMCFSLFPLALKANKHISPRGMGNVIYFTLVGRRQQVDLRQMCDMGVPFFVQNVQMER